MTTRAAMDTMLSQVKGDHAAVKQRLAIPREHWNEELIRIDVDNPLLYNARMPSGLEQGADPVLFRWGGYTKGGIPEIAVDPLPGSAVRATPTGIKPCDGN